MGLMILVLMLHVGWICPELFRKRQWKELSVIIGLSLAALFLSGLLIINSDPPKLGPLIGRLIGPIIRWMGLGIFFKF